ncbi:MAG TPA: choice-of-anchor J domain-containing protein [Candidatus Cloacimonas sp.]|nr:choice-of-anchor J domain-containing protein [Candidatus Cloacimonas sp.]HQO17765.1 choice-of-anchor J domain-containing protein [Candidatus Cloacimonas sp.]
MRKLILLALLFGACLHATVITIGNENLLNKGLPIEPIAHFSYSQQLYLPAEIGCAGMITAVSFQYNVNSNVFYNANKTWKIWMGHTSVAEITNWLPLDNMQVVYNHNLQETDFLNGLPGNGWLVIELETPFLYNGLDALLLAVDENSIGFGSSSDDFSCSSCPLNYAIQYQSPQINPDPLLPPESGWTLKNFRSNLQLTIEAQYYTPISPIPANGAGNISVDTSLSWTSICSSFSLSLGTHPDSLQQIVSQTPLTYWQPETPFQFNKTYYWKVTGYTNESVYPSLLWNFTTVVDYISPPQNLSGFYNGSAAQLTWSPPATNNQSYYKIYRNASFYTATLEPFYNDNNVQAEVSYYYYVTAVNISGSESAPSNVITITVPAGGAERILFQGFENCPSFSGAIAGWQNLDLDLAQTSDWQDVTYPNEGNPAGWLCFEPANTIPPLLEHPSYAGNKMLASICSMPPPNNDWLISPVIHLGTESSLQFVARSAYANFGLERLSILISNTDDELGSFVPIQADAYLSVPVEWTDYQYSISAWDNQNVYLAWRCLSVDAMALFLDNIEVNSHNGYVANSDLHLPQPGFNCYPNPSRGFFTVESKAGTLFTLELYNLKGQCLHREKDISNWQSSHLQSKLANGIYFLRIVQAGKVITLKQVIVK